MELLCVELVMKRKEMLGIDNNNELEKTNDNTEGKKDDLIIKNKVNI